ncbi:MAG: TrkA C-terminal domain-containing protein, partial [Cyanobacteria bacterium J06607_6]
IQEMPVDQALVGGTIGDVEMRGKGTFIIVALRRADGEVIVHPGNNLYLAKEDTLMLMGHQGDMPNFAQKAAIKREMRYRGARLR